MEENKNADKTFAVTSCFLGLCGLQGFPTMYGLFFHLAKSTYKQTNQFGYSLGQLEAASGDVSRYASHDCMFD